MSRRSADIPGWFTWRAEQEEAVAYFPQGSVFVEVGLYLGRSVCSLGEVVRNSGKLIEVIGIDTCVGSGPEGQGQNRGDYHAEMVWCGSGTFAGFLHRNVLECGLSDVISLVIAPSIRAASMFQDGTLSWVHLDASHDRASVEADITAWLPKIRRGGWISGDDYDSSKWPGVVEAVAAMLPESDAWGHEQWRAVIE